MARSQRRLALNVGVSMMLFALLPTCTRRPSSEGSASSSGALITQVSDPAPCLDRYEHIWVTVTSIKANIAASAEPDAAGFVDLTPALQASPRQIDLLGPLTSCFPPQVGTVSGIKPATYQQLRVFLLENLMPPAGTSAPSPNECRAAGDTVFNCVIDAKGAVKPLKLSEDAKKGIKVPQSQLACGGLAIKPGEGEDIDIYFNSCASVTQGADPSALLLRPVIWGHVRQRPPAE